MRWCCQSRHQSILQLVNVCTNDRFMLFSFLCIPGPMFVEHWLAKILSVFCFQLYSAISCKALYNTFLKSVTLLIYKQQPNSGLIALLVFVSTVDSVATGGKQACHDNMLTLVAHKKHGNIDEIQNNVCCLVDQMREEEIDAMWELSSWLCNWE